MILVYKAKNVRIGKTYIGVTNNFSRRLVEHISSDTDFGRDLDNNLEDFTFNFETFSSYREAYKKESQLVTEAEASTDSHYNQRLGGEFGKLSKFASNKAHDNHPTHFSSSYNPMHNEDCKSKMISKQKCKPVSVSGIEYRGVREASRLINMSRQGLVYRLKSDNYPDYFYI